MASTSTGTVGLSRRRRRHRGGHSIPRLPARVTTPEAHGRVASTELGELLLKRGIALLELLHQPVAEAELASMLENCGNRRPRESLGRWRRSGGRIRAKHDYQREKSGNGAAQVLSVASRGARHLEVRVRIPPRPMSHQPLPSSNPTQRLAATTPEAYGQTNSAAWSASGRDAIRRHACRTRFGSRGAGGSIPASTRSATAAKRFESPYDRATSIAPSSAATSS